MPEEFDRVVVIAGAAVAVLLQVIVAPNIALFSAVPNFLLAYALVVSIVRAPREGVVLPFVMGLLFDLLGHGPVGAMAFLLVIAAFAASRLFAVLNNDTLFMPVTILVAATFAVEVLYGVFLAWFGADISVLQAFVYRALPCTLYDVAVGLVLYAIVSRLMSGQPPQQPGMTQLR